MAEENREDVKSKAVVTYSRQRHPEHYKKLKENFNLKQPLGSRLQQSSKWQSYVRGSSSGKQDQFTSFNIAHNFRDMAGEVDVISDAENIKKLLKMPFGNKAQISMMVHRVGSSLLLDDFDVHRLLLRQQQNDWKWLRKFYYKIVAHNMQHKDKLVVKKNKTRDFLQSREMFSKFLYYSSHDNQATGSHDAGHSPSNPHDVNVSSDLVDSLQFLPDYTEEGAEVEEPEFQRTVNWTFEDISMLIGTNLPIFGEGTHPCVSLRLRDMQKPINVLTGLDYWLDNLMCNVPELAMCYHIDGIVQKYELLKTEDIPSLENARFKPQLVKDIAQNILSFLKSNATKEGHTYWLFKGTDEDVVKLYDLTTLCADDMDSDSQNPFTVPVGILLYRVARNICQTQGRNKSGTIRTLLENCITLLDKDIHSQVITSAHYLLSDLYISNNLEQQQPVVPVNQAEAPPTESKKSQAKKKKSKKQELERVEKHEQRGCQSAELLVPMLLEAKRETLKRSGEETARHPPVTGDVRDRAREALSHIAQGLTCLDQSAAFLQKNSQESEEYQAQCKPTQAIPLHYTPLQKQEISSVADEKYLQNNGEIHDGGDGASCNPQGKAGQMTVWSGSLPHKSWHTSSKVLLLMKAVLTYKALCEADMKDEQYGGALRCASLAVLCFNAVKALDPLKAKEHASLLMNVLTLCGDVYLMLSHCTTDRMSAHRHWYEERQQGSVAINKSAGKEVKQDHSLLGEFHDSSQKNLELSVRCYQDVVDLSSTTSDCPSGGGDACTINASGITSLKRLANAHNELGVYCMNQAAKAEGKVPDNVQSLCDGSCKHLLAGIAAFERIGDWVNMALLYSNLGRVMRIQASHSVSVQGTGQREFTNAERLHYIEALDHYQKARSLLERRERQPQIWDSITWEMSTVYFTMATLMQDFAPLSRMPQEQVEKEVTDLMMKALKNCDVDIESPRQPTCQYRAASIHHRLASLYHNTYRGQVSEQKKKHLRQLAELHYGKAWRYFTEVESACEMLRVLLEQVAMCEFHVSGVTGNAARIKTLQVGLSHLLGSELCLKLMENQLLEESTSEPQGYQEEADKLMTILVSRLNFFLMNLVKGIAQSKKGKSPDDLHSTRLQIMKSMYQLVLKHSQGEPKPPSHQHQQIYTEGGALKPQLITKCQKLSQLLHKLKDMYQEFEHSLRTGTS